MYNESGMNRKTLECNPGKHFTDRDVDQLRSLLHHEANAISSLQVYVRQFKFKGKLRVTIDYPDSLAARARLDNMFALISRFTGSAPETLSDGAATQD